LRFRKAIAILAAALASLDGLAAATAPKKKTSHARSAAHKAPVRTVHATGPARTGKAVKKGTARPARPARPARSAWRAGQSEPTPERYKQFQEALIAKGYLQGEASGKWDEASADAMRRFQKDQNLEPTGKPNQSLSIIALGLGPKY
jgi:peptidoglycan hydrolase-like protein with peptidoglycan-binding domain